MGKWNLVFMIVFALMMFQVTANHISERRLGGAGATEPPPPPPPPDCSYANVNWNLDLGCKTCSYEPQYFNSNDPTSDTMETEENETLWNCDTWDGVTASKVVSSTSDCGLTVTGSGNSITINYGGMTKSYCGAKATVTMSISHAELSIEPESESFIVNATRCWISAQPPTQPNLQFTINQDGYRKIALAGFQAYGGECGEETLTITQAPSGISTADAYDYLWNANSNEIHFNHASKDAVTSDKAGRYRLHKRRYNTRTDPYLFLCEIDIVPIDILEPAGQTTEFIVDDDCLLGKDTSGSHCKSCPECLNGFYQEHTYNTAPIAWTALSPSNNCAYTLVENCDGLDCVFSQNDNLLTIRIDDQTEVRDYNVTFMLSSGDASAAFTKEYSFIITLKQNLVLLSDTTDWFCLHFAAPIPTTPPVVPVEKVCKNDYSLRKEQDYGDYYWVSHEKLINPDPLLWYDDPDFPTDTLSFSSLLIDGTAAPVDQAYLVSTTNQRYDIDTTDIQNKVFQGWDTARIEVVFRIGYTKLPMVYLESPLVTLNFNECEKLPNNIPFMDNQYVELGELSYLTVDDSHFDHKDAWCYPYKKFQFEDLSSGPISTGSPSWVKAYIQMAPPTPINGIYEQYGQEPEWTENFYLVHASIQSFDDPPQSYDIRLTLQNDADYEIYSNAGFNAAKLIFYKIEIDQLWNMPEAPPGLVEQIFSFAWQDTFWDGTQEKNGTFSYDKKVRSFTNYYQANANNDAYARAIFTGYNSTLFNTLVVDATNYQHNPTEMWIEIKSLDPILEEEFLSEFERQAYLQPADPSYNIGILPQYSVKLTYRLVDCTQDFSIPEQFLLSRIPEDFQDGVVNQLDANSRFVLQHEEQVDKTHIFDLFVPEQKYAETCGTVQYNLTVEDEKKFEGVFDKQGYTLTARPKFAKSGPYFEARLRWVIHNDYFKHNMGTITIVQHSCMKYFVDAATSKERRVSYALKPATYQAQHDWLINLLAPVQYGFSWPQLEFEMINCPINRYKVNCLDDEENEYTVGYYKETLKSASRKCQGFKYDTDKGTILAPKITKPGSPFEGSYTFTITGSNIDETSVESAPIRISASLFYDSDNTAPYPEVEPKSLMIGQGEKKVRAIGTIIDDEGDYSYLESYEFDYTEPIDWIELKNQTNQNLIKFVIAPPADAPLMTVRICYTLADNNLYQRKAKYCFQATILDNSSFDSDSLTDVNGFILRPPQMIFEPLDRDDNLVIKFTEAIKFPEGIQNLTSQHEFRNLQAELANLNFFKIEFEASDATKSKLYELDMDGIKTEWTIKIESSSRLKINFKFIPEDLISTNGLDPDKIKLHVFKPFIFVGNTTGLPAVIMKEQENYSAEVGFMLQRVGGVSKRGGPGQNILEDGQNSFANAVKAIMAGNAILAIFLSGVLQYLMGFLSVLQLMVIPVLFQIAHPSNSQVIQVTILQLCAFDFFQTEQIYEKYFGLETGEPFSDNFDEAGLEGHNFIIGIGPVFFYILAFPLYILIHKLSQWLCADEWMLEKFNRSKAYNVIALTFLFSTCFELSITACISVAKVDSGDFATFWNFVAISMAFLTLVALAMAPFFVYRASKRYNQDENYKELYKDFFEDKREGIFALNFQNFFLIRRYVLTASLVFLWDPEFQLVQINGFILSTLAFTMYISYYRPFKDSQFCKVEIINELILLFSSYFLFYYADYNNQAGFHEFKYNVGWLMILVIVIFIIYNVTVISRQILVVVKAKHRARQAAKKQRRRFKYSQQVEEERLRQISEIKKDIDLQARFQFVDDDTQDQAPPPQKVCNDPLLISMAQNRRLTRQLADKMITTERRRRVLTEEKSDIDQTKAILGGKKPAFDWNAKPAEPELDHRYRIKNTKERPILDDGPNLLVEQGKSDREESSCGEMQAVSSIEEPNERMENELELIQLKTKDSRQDFSLVKPTSIMMQQLLPNYCNLGVNSFNITEVVYQSTLKQESELLQSVEPELLSNSATPINDISLQTDQVSDKTRKTQVSEVISRQVMDDHKIQEISEHRGQQRQTGQADLKSVHPPVSDQEGAFDWSLHMQGYQDMLKRFKKK